MKTVFFLVALLSGVSGVVIAQTSFVESKLSGITPSQQRILDGIATIDEIRHELMRRGIKADTLKNFGYIKDAKKANDAWNERAFLIIVFKDRLRVHGERYDHGTEEYKKQAQAYFNDK